MDRNDLLLYAITDGKCIGSRDFYSEVENALRGGVTFLQLREKELTDAELTEKARKVKRICDRYNVPLIINDNVFAAMECGAAGVHVGADDMKVSEIRKMTGSGFIIGATAKTVEQAVKAEAEGADYLGCGALFVSSTKKNARPMTIETLKEITKAVSIPVVAIGGLSYDNMEIIRGSGVCGAAVVSAVFAQADVKTAAERLKRRVGEILNVYQTL